MIAISLFSGSNTSLAARFRSNVAIPCPSPSIQTPVNRSLIQDVAGTLQSVSGQKFVIALPKGSPPTVSATYSATTHFTQVTSITTAALKPGLDVSVQAIPNANGTYTATKVTVRQQNGPSCFDGPPPNLSASPVVGNQPNNRRCLGSDGPPPSSTVAVCLEGTIKQFSGTTLTVQDDRQAKTYSVTLTKTTQLLQDAPATAASLTAKAFVIVTGIKTNTTITAFHVTVLGPGVAIA